MPSNHTTIGTYNLEHKGRYAVIIGEEWYIFVLQEVPTRDFVAVCMACEQSRISELLQNGALSS